MRSPGPALPLPFLGALEAARRRYRSYPNVLGVAGGFKFRGGRRAGAPAVQFFVSRKLTRPRRRLPRFVLGRDRRGRVLRHERIPTDVIAVRAPRFACGAGDGLRARGERGSMALLFRNKSPRDKSPRDKSARETAPAADFYLLTCAHVAGDLERSPPLSPGLSASCRPRANPFALALKNSLAEAGEVEYDVALARVSPGALPLPDLGIRGGGRLAGWLEPERLWLGAELWISAASGRRRGVLESLWGEFQVKLDGRTYRVRNVFGLRAPVRDGDSGGLVHRRGLAAGMVVARSPGGFAWFQPLHPALDHVNRCLPRTKLEPFLA